MRKLESVERMRSRLRALYIGSLLLLSRRSLCSSRPRCFLASVIRFLVLFLVHFRSSDSRRASRRAEAPKASLASTPLFSTGSCKSVRSLGEARGRLSGLRGIDESTLATRRRSELRAPGPRWDERDLRMATGLRDLGDFLPFASS